MEVREGNAAYLGFEGADAHEIMSGTKQTEVGVIPTQWEVKRLGELFEITSSKRVFQSEWKTDGVPFYRARELAVLGESGRVDNDLFIAREKYLAFKRAHGVPAIGDLLVTGVGTLGKVYLVVEGHEFYFKDGNIIWFKIEGSLTPEFLRQLFLTPLLAKQISDGSAGTTVGTYTITGAKKTVIPLPPPREQEAIAKALSDADALIESLEQLIAKKRQIKQGTMQALLTGEQRLPGFRGEIESRRLDQLGRWVGGMTPSMRNPSYWQGGTVPWISSGDVKLSRLKQTSLSVTTTALKDHATTLVPENSVVVVMRSGILRKFFPVAMNMVPMAINQDLKALIPQDGVCAEYILHALIGSGDEILARCLKSGTTVESIEFGWLKSFAILVPAFEEQTAIATILTDMDTELAELETRLAKTRQLKRGMMQELLTGRIRLV